MSSQPRPQPQTYQGQPYQPISGSGTRLQPHPVDQDTLTIDQRLYSAITAISESRNILSSNRTTITTCQQQLKEWSEAYTALEIEHKKTSTDLENMTQNHLFISEQLKEARRSYESNVKEYERRLQAALSPRQSQNMDQEMREYHEKLTAAEKELNGMLEKDREHQSDLRKVRDQLDTAQQNLVKLRKEKEDLIREHQDAVDAAETRTAVAEKKIIDLEKQRSDLISMAKKLKVESQTSRHALATAEERIAELETEVDSIQEHQDALATAEERIAELETEVDSIQEHRDALAATEEAGEKRIAKLETEKAELIQKHQNALAAVEEAWEKRVAKLETEKAELIQKHRNALAAAEDRAMVVPEMITELEKETVGLIYRNVNHGN
jgi:chromosome segregation ATPase